MPITEEQKQKAFEYVQDTCNTIHAAIYHLQLDCTVEEFVDAMMDFNYECCPTCGWWCECHERIPSDDHYPEGMGMTPDRYCDNCRPSPENYKYKK